MKNALLVLIFFLLGLAIVLGYRFWNKQVTVFKPTVTTKFSLENAPSESLRGNISTLSGTVAWLSRTGAKPVQIKTPRAIQQGESVTTGTNGKAVLLIKNDSMLSLSTDTQISIIQLLPQNFVFEQDKGTIQYQNTVHVPLSVKSYDLLTIITSAIVTISVDSKKKTVSVAVERGSVKEGYEDSQNNSTVSTINAGQTFVFDDTTKTGTVE